ncbi:G patch domain-containing protein 4-like [Daphnia carinata]|uniref:G patch domain-containing protein 4-like n=1 Tax=Daphnia carinata TaxID=120202 RepID=UPI00257AE8B1|nr:G patch domain-containing protein 4-like [Daphnia carinata]
MESKGMQNARKMLEKLGWSEGSGLGLNENGITEAIKPSAKFDLSGIGHKTYNDFQWWDHAFNKAAQAFDIKVTDDQGAIVEKTKTVGKIKTKKGSSNVNQADLAYGVFHKTGTLHNGIIESKENSVELKEETDYSLKLSDEELFKLCNGLTAHKGARHGLTARGKLARIAMQEAALLASMNANDNKIPHQPETKKKKKKSAKCSKDENVNQTPSECGTLVSCVENINLCEKLTKLKKKKKSRKETECEVGESDICENALISVHEKDLVHNKAEKRQKKKADKYRNGNDENLLSEPIEEISQEPPKKKKKSKNYESESHHLLLEESVEQIGEEPKRKKKKKSSQSV